ncbi:MAG: hypothetical protein LBL66_05595 [Clostridiales bacterium]|nr:hypothetical protein [Clostridiales bacterium]
MRGARSATRQSLQNTKRAFLYRDCMSDAYRVGQKRKSPPKPLPRQVNN